jgi:hypothetical protein
MRVRVDLTQDLCVNEGVFYVDQICVNEYGWPDLCVNEGVLCGPELIAGWLRYCTLV